MVIFGDTCDEFFPPMPCTTIIRVRIVRYVRDAREIGRGNCPRPRWLDELIADPTATADSIAKAGTVQRAKDQHDNLACFPCVRSGQSCHRWPAPLPPGRCSSHRPAGGMVPAVPGARPSWAIIACTRTESRSVAVAVRGNRNQRRTRRNHFSEIQSAFCRDQALVHATSPPWAFR